MKKSSFCVLLIASLLTLTGCNTAKGVGQDLQKAGATIENAAKKN